MEKIRSAGFSGKIELDVVRGKRSEWSERELELGPCEGPWIRAASFHAVEASREFAVRLAMDPDTVWTPLSELRAMDPERGLIGVEGRNDSLGVLNWLYPRRLTALDALRAVEEDEIRGGKILPPAVVAACMAASLGVKQGLRRIERTPALFAGLANASPAGHPTDVSDAELEKSTEDFMDAALKGGFSRAMPGGAVDRARYWLGVAQALWDGRTRKRLARCRLNAETAAALAELAAAWLSLKARPVVSVSGVTLRVGGPAKLHAWPQVMEWEYGRVSRKALQYLTGYHGKMLGSPEINVLAGKRAGGEVKLRVDWLEAIKLGGSLLQDAAERATCRPCGSFRIAVPEGAPPKLTFQTHKILTAMHRV